MSFRLFIYYCAVAGAWGAFAAWCLVQILRVPGIEETLWRDALVAGLLGVVVAAVVGGLDASLNSGPFEGLLRVLVCGVIGLVGGLIGGLVGSLLGSLGVPFAVAWLPTGLAIGGAVGTYDLIQAATRGKGSRGAIRKLVNGLIGGLVGGLVGGLGYSLLSQFVALPRTGVALGLVLVGGSVGLGIALAQVAFSEAWLKVVSGFRPGREIILTKEETVIGRSEGCDLGLFGDSKVEKVHAHIRYDGGSYLLSDNNTEDGTYVNDERVGPEPVVLKNGDRIEVGNSVLEFGTRQRERAQTRRSRRERR